MPDDRSAGHPTHDRRREGGRDRAHNRAHDPAHDRAHDEQAHDVLAAEEFGMPARDPALHREAAHDVLAAEEFGMPAGDPALHHGPVTLPSDPTGIAEPHDVLAAEEFAMPAPRGTETLEVSAPRRRAPALLAVAAIGLIATFLLRKRRR